MRLLLIGLLALLLTSTAWAQDKKIEKVDRKNSTGLLVESYTLVDGKREGAYISRHENGKTSKEGNYKDGKESGTWVSYHDNGNPSLSADYVAGEMDGAVTTYFATGVTHVVCTFSKGYANGEWIVYHENGQVSARGKAYSSWYNNVYGALLTGEWKWFNDKGVLTLHGTYEQNELTGHAIQYYESGSKRTECDFAKGRANGEWIAYHENGQIHARGMAYSSWHNQFYGPELTGEWNWFNERGILTLNAIFVQNERQGHATSYYDSGSKRVECDFAKGYANGEWVEYHENGNVALKGNASSSWHNQFYAPVREGLWISYFVGGAKYVEATFVGGVRDGGLVEYYESGTERVTCEYDNGSLTGTWTSRHEDGQLAALGEAIGQAWGSHNHPIRTGLWAEYFADGIRRFEGNYVNGAFDGICSWYHANGQKQYLTEWVEGTMRGSWTSWFNNGNTAAHGHCYGNEWGSQAHPLKQGPWVFYHSNGPKESEGRYVENQKVGAWIYYDANEKLKKVENYINGESKALSDAELPDGSHVYRASNPDGSSDTFTFDKDGKLVSSKHELPLDKQKPYVQYTDPDTGETVTITHDSDGHPTRTRGRTTKDDKGNTRTVETDDDGKTRVIDEHADGSKTITETWPDGTLRETKRDKAGNVTRTRTNPDGSVTQYENHPDGSRSRKRIDSDGNLVDETFRDPSGVETTNRPDGTSTRRHKDENGNTVETTTRPDGGKSRVVRDPEGNIISRDDNWGERDPGRTLYEDQENGHDWDKLTDGERKEFADREEAMRESGGLDELRIRADEAAMRERDDARKEADAAAAEAEKDLARKPAAEGAEKEKKEVNFDELSLALKAVELALMMPDVLIEHIKSELTRGMSDEDAEEAKVADMLKQNARGLPGWLHRNPKVLKNWEERVKPTLKSGASAIAAALSVLKGIQHAEKGEYFNALECFADASVSVFGILPPSVTEKLEKELRRNPTKYASAIKNVITFAKELGRPLKAGDSRNYGILVREAINFLVNIYQAVPKAERQAFMKRYMPTFRGWFNAANAKVRGTPVRGAQILLGVVDCAEETYKLISEWGGENDAANITSLAKKVGPKAIGMLVHAATGSETAGGVAEYIAQMGADYMARLGDEAREAAKAALAAAMADANAAANLRSTLNELAINAGMSEEDARAYTNLSTNIAGHSSRLVLSDMRQKKDVAGIREATQAWRRVNSDMGARCGAVQFFYDGLVPDKQRKPENEEQYQIWYRTWVDNARRTAAHINTILADYARGSAAHRFLSTWKADLDDLVRVYG